MNFLQRTRLKQANLSRALTIQADLRVQWCLPAQAILTEKKAREDTEEALLRMMEVTAASSCSDKNPCLPHFLSYRSVPAFTLAGNDHISCLSRYF